MAQATSLNTVSAEDKRKMLWGGVGKASYGKLSDKAEETSARLLGRFKSLSSPLRRVCRDLESSSFFSGRERGGGHHYNFPYIVNGSYKRVTAMQVSKLLLCLLFLKNNQCKIIVMPKSDKFCSPSTQIFYVDY